MGSSSPPFGRRVAADSGPPASRTLPRGGWLPREHVSEVQRMRILAAMAEVAAERGIETTTVARVVARAGVSRRTFYELFEDRAECFLAVFDEAVADARERVLGAWKRDGRWVERVRAALLALLVFFDEEPQLAQSCVVQALAAGPRMLARRGEVLAALARAVDEGRAETRAKADPPPLTAEGVVGAVGAILHARLLEARPAPTTELLGSLMGLIVLPYLGPAAAARELARPAPAIARAAAAPARSPLEGIGMRITYRTLRVLSTIAAQPGISNRAVAERAGIADQGQISRLLTRLEDIGLVENTGAGHARGATNAWRLTAKGAEVQPAITVAGRAQAPRRARRRS